MKFHKCSSGNLTVFAWNCQNREWKNDTGIQTDFHETPNVMGYHSKWRQRSFSCNFKRHFYERPFRAHFGRKKNILRKTFANTCVTFANKRETIGIKLCTRRIFISVGQNHLKFTQSYFSKRESKLVQMKFSTCFSEEKVIAK